MGRFGLVIVWIGIIWLFLHSATFVQFFYHPRSISVLAWPVVLDESHLEKFTAKTGIRVYVNYFESNDELITKLTASDGQGYDLVMPSSYAVERLSRQGLLKPIDKDKIKFWDKVIPSLLDHSFDRKNTYSIPYEWGVYGIAVNTNFFGGRVPEASWNLIFGSERDKNLPIAMVDDAREAVSLAALYLFGHPDTINQQMYAQIMQLLKQQKSSVVMYGDMRVDQALALDVVALAVMSSTDVTRAVKHNPKVQFLLPREGSFLEIDSFVIPRACQKEEEVYQFLNYLYRSEVLGAYASELAFFPATTDTSFSYDGFSFDPMTYTLFDNLHFFRSNIAADVLTKMWVTLKASAHSQA